MQKLEGYEKAVEVLNKNLSYRSVRLRNLEKFVDGTQYEGLPDWFSDTKPLWERAPCVVDPIVKNAIESNTDLLLSEDRFPLITVDGLEGDDASLFEKAVASVKHQARLQPSSREAFAGGQGCGSACGIFGTRSGRLFIDIVHASWCEPQLNADGSVASLEIRYPFIDIVKNKATCKIFRRVIDGMSDTTFVPVIAPEDGSDPNSWTPDTVNTFQHNLGFCPVVWYAHMRGCPIHGDVDGHAIHERITDEVRAHDFAKSQKHRAALYAGDPQWTEVGVSPGYSPTAEGRRAEVVAASMGRPGDSAREHYVLPAEPGSVRRKSPGTVWQYEDPEVKVQLHTLPGDALQAIADHAADLRGTLCEALGVVFLDLEKMPSESRMSGRGLEMIRGRQLERVDNYRVDFGDRFLVPALGMLLRISISKGLKIQGLDVVKKVAASYPHWSWHAPPLNLSWGRYYRATGDEEELTVRALVEAKNAGLATTRACVEKLRSILDVKDIASYMKELTAENAKKAALMKPPTPVTKVATTTPVELTKNDEPPAQAAE